MKVLHYAIELFHAYRQKCWRDQSSLAVGARAGGPGKARVGPAVRVPAVGPGAARCCKQLLAFGAANSPT